MSTAWHGHCRCTLRLHAAPARCPLPHLHSSRTAAVPCTAHLPHSAPSVLPPPFLLVPSPLPPHSLSLSSSLPPRPPSPFARPRIIVPSLRDFAKRADDKAKNSGIRLVKIWEERRVFSPSQTKDLKEALKAAPAVKAPQGSAAKGAGEEQKKAQVGGGGVVPGGGRRGTATGWLS